MLSLMPGPVFSSRWAMLTGVRLVASIGLAAASGLFEILQNFVLGRSPKLIDAVASTGGLTGGMAVAALLTAALTMRARG
jgi:VanZ family protein